MLIQIKQPDIEAAIKAHLQSQGISMQGKEVNISFHAGRKNTGLSAEVSIEEQTAKVSLISKDPTPYSSTVTEVTPAPVNLFN